MEEERINPVNYSSPYILEEHLARYIFAKKFIYNKDVLDIACGEGYGSNILIAGNAKKVVGVDISEETVQNAKIKYRKDNLEFYQGNAEEIRYDSDYFDAVISFETIEHLDNPQKFLEEVKRVLKPGGIFILSTPNRILTSCYFIYKHPFNKFHKLEFNKKELLNIINIYFSNISLYGQRFVLNILTPYIIRKLLEKSLKIVYPKFEEKIYHECGGPEVKKINFFQSPTYFVLVAVNEK